MQGREHRLRIRDGRLLGLDLLQPHLRVEPPALEDRQLNGGTERAEVARRLDELGKSLRLKAARGGERQLRKVVGDRDTDFGRGRVQVGFCLTDVRTAAREIRRQPDRNHGGRGRHRLRPLELGAQRLGRPRHQLAQLVDIDRDLPIRERQLGLRRADFGLGVLNVEIRREAGVAPVTCELQEIPLRRQAALQDLAAQLRTAQVDVGRRHVAHHREERRVRALDRRLHLGVGGLDRAPLAAENIERPGGAEAELILVVGIDQRRGQVRES